ncbi:hypothetical protein [Streptomyces sp. MK7]|uniref:hypothetical protein n=1 Tax=Streptomyces sp. MK7 TaxID=3067635 RepID=UPI002931C6FC|nr:hypothetical protein [Streptomyces sp. MK7]
MPTRRQPDPLPNGPNFGIIAHGDITGPAQAAAFSHNATQTNNITNEPANEARENIQTLRRRLEELRGRYPEVDAALRDLDEIEPRLNTPEHEPGTLRYMLHNLVQHCGGIPNLLTAAQLVQSTVLALLPSP